MSDLVLVDYGAKSMLARWFDQYWSESDRKTFPWLCVIVLAVFLFCGPQFLLWLVGYLPADQLGNSGASVSAHKVIEAIAIAFALAATVLLVKPHLRPKQISLSANGVGLIWSLGPIKISGKKLKWQEITSIHMYQPMDSIASTNCQLQFATTQRLDAISINLKDLDSDERRQVIADAIAKYAVHAVEPDVFTALAPQRALSFTELWLDALSAAPERQRLLPLEDGALLDGRYRVINKLGSGGQGSAYLAEDTKAEDKKVEDGSAGRIVLKESILPVYADIISRRQALEAFHKEAFALESVKHKNIVRFRGSFVADHRAYLILDFVAGKTISQVVKDSGPMDNARVSVITMQLCDILTLLHNQAPPMVHRDFTPDNIILGAEDQVTLIDFAVSTAASAYGDELSGEVAGKAAYMAPEQFKGLPQAQSDIYALGATMYYMLTGEHAEPISESHPILANEKVSKELNDIVAGATKLEISKRYANAEAVKRAVTALC